jgi:hypothetical protein
MNPVSIVLSGNDNLILELPPELLFEVASHLDLPDILRLCQTSSYFRGLFCSMDQTLWRYLYRRDLSTLRTPPDQNYQQAYLTYFRKIRGTSLDDQLLLASRNGYERMVQRLIDDGATDYTWAMVEAAGRGHRDIVDLMLQLGAGPQPSWVPEETDYDLAMAEAALGGHRDVVQLMLQRGANNYDRAMFQAAEGGHRDIVDLMLQLGATNYDGAMAAAARGGHRDIVDLMLQLGATDYNWAMESAAGGGHRDIVDYLRDYQLHHPH